MHSTAWRNAGGSGDPDGDDGTSRSGGPDGDDGTRGMGSGGPGSPGAAALGALPADAGPTTGALPQTGAEHGPALGLLGLLMVLAGMLLSARRREEARA